LENKLVPYLAIKNIPCTQAIVFAPHPDDEVFGCGGAIMRHVEQGIPVRVIIVSDGASGVSEDKISEYALQRQHESIAAAHILGYGLPVFWHYPDRQICYGEKLIQEILTVIRETGADLVYAPSVFEMHPDHRTLGMAVVEAIRRIGKSVCVALYEVGMPLRPNQLLDISELAARKTAAMECFSSQNAKQRYDLHIAALNRYRTYTLPASITAAEAYMLISAEELSNDPLKLYQSEHTRQRALGLVLDNSDMPLVSVIIRSMDRPTLSDALDSIALQTYPHIEVVIVNAKGADHRDVGEWCGRFPIRLIMSDGSLNRSRAANIGLNSATGNYLIFLDDDDLFDPDHIAHLVETLNDSKNCSVAYAGVRVENEAGAISGTFNQTFAAARLMAGNFIPIHAVLFKRGLVAQGCRFDENLDSYEDWDFWLQVARQTDFAHTAKVTAVYRAQLGNSGMSQPLARYLPLQRQCRLMVWEKWWHKWTANDFDSLITDFHQQLTLLQQQLGDSIHTENELRYLLAETKRLQAEHEARIATLNQAVSGRDEQIIQLRSTIAEIFDSRSWKLTVPIRFFSRITRRILQYGRPASHLILQYYRRESGYKLLQRIFSILRNEGLNGIKRRLKTFHNNNKPIATGLKAKPTARLEKHNHLPLSTIDITKYDFFFFDVFDTAIIRLFQKPTDLFEYISFKTKDPDFNLRRVQQEIETRKQHKGRKEISIFEIYNNLASDSIEEEIAAELKFCTANPEVHKFYSRLLSAGKKIYFVSDMYLDKETISKILQASGYCAYENVYVSSDDDLLKGDGSRFEWLKRNIPESIGATIHIGDNRISDFSQPQTHGFDAFHYMEHDTYYRQDPFLYSKIEFLNSKHSVGLSFLLATFRYWKLGFHDQSPGYWRQFGFLYGGALISAFCGFINKQLASQKLSCDKIYFLARDGDIMSQVYRLLYDDVQAVYLMASRRCMLFPSIKSLTHADDEEALKQFIGPLGNTSAKDILERFGYADLENLEADLQNIGPDPSKWTERDIHACILRHKQSIMKKVVAERNMLFDYLTEINFFDQDDIVIVDVGWGGSIQNSLVKLLELWNYSAKHLHGIYLGVNENAAYKQNKTGFLYEGNQSQFLEHINLIELITSSPQYGVVRIDRADGIFVPVTEAVNKDEEKRHLVSAEIQKGILDFARLIKKHDIDIVALMHVNDFKTLFESLQECASEEDIVRLGQLKHAAMIGNRYTHPVLNLKTRCMHDKKLVTVFINPEMYNRFFTSNAHINYYDLVDIDNRQLNRGLPVIYNEVIANHIDDDCWLFFVHEDFEIKCDLAVINNLDRGSIYGTFGVNLEHDVPVGYGKHICSKKDGSGPLDIGNEILDTVKVQTLDCQSILLHTSLLAKYPLLRFDEKLTFDLYAEDFSINAQEKYGIDIKVFPLIFQHYSYGKVTERYHAGLRYLAEKYPSVGVAGSCSFIGGRANELEKKYTYDIPANPNNNK
jgi:predicted HAD superfamily hydrolase/LmbE family N-acetylglucosaminyl deacetylase